MIDCSRDGAYRRGRETRALSVTSYSNAFDYRTSDSGRRMNKAECSRHGIPSGTKCVINPSQMDLYLDPGTPMDGVPKGVSHYIEENEGGRAFVKGKVFILEGGRGPEEPQNASPGTHPLDEGW